MSSSFKMYDSATGEPAMSFHTVDDAKAYAEATVNLRLLEVDDG